MSLPKQIFIVGPRGSGKSEFAVLLELELRKVTGERWPVQELSAGIVRRLAHILSHGPWPHAVGQDGWAKFLIENKELYRPMLRAYGDQMAVDGAGTLIEEAADNGKIIVGARREKEIEAYYRNLLDLNPWAAAEECEHKWIYVERPDGVQPPRGDSFDGEFFQKFCSRHVVNCGGISDLAGIAGVLVKEWMQ